MVGVLGGIVSLPIALNKDVVVCILDLLSLVDSCPICNHHTCPYHSINTRICSVRK